VTDEAKKWDGWHTNVRPAYEPIVMFMKPFEGSFINNLRQNDVGALNIDATRIPFSNDKESKKPKARPEIIGKTPFPSDFAKAGHWDSEIKKDRSTYYAHEEGRYPTNLIRTTPFNDGYDNIFLIPKPSVREKGSFNSHPSVKPLALMEQLVKLVSKEDQYVLDPFVGSGTTVLACFLHNINFVGIDLSKKYLQIAIKRLKNAKKSTNLKTLLE